MKGPQAVYACNEYIYLDMLISGVLITEVVYAGI